VLDLRVLRPGRFVQETPMTAIGLGLGREVLDTAPGIDLLYAAESVLPRRAVLLRFNQLLLARPTCR
jgi:hypothetical protein